MKEANGSSKTKALRLQKANTINRLYKYLFPSLILIASAQSHSEMSTNNAHQRHSPSFHGQTSRPAHAPLASPAKKAPKQSAFNTPQDSYKTLFDTDVHSLSTNTSNNSQIEHAETSIKKAEKRLLTLEMVDENQWTSNFEENGLQTMHPPQDLPAGPEPKIVQELEASNLNLLTNIPGEPKSHTLMLSGLGFIFISMKIMKAKKDSRKNPDEHHLCSIFSYRII